MKPEQITEALLKESAYRGIFHMGPVAAPQVAAKLNAIGYKATAGTEKIYVEPLYGQDEHDARMRFLDRLKAKLGTTFGLGTGVGSNRGEQFQKIGA